MKRTFNYFNCQFIPEQLYLREHCSLQVQETYAGSSLGFRNQNTFVTINCKKGGVSVWQS